jgi:triacylglycerol lipase
MKKVVAFFMLMLLLFPTEALGGKSGTPGNPGDWYVKDNPANSDPSKAPLVFVHGLNSSSYVWWEENDMYDLALERGYETAFVDLYPVNNMWDNGSMLASMLGEIYEYFGEKPLVLVTHSKGGVDAQSALVHYGANEYVSNVFTLSSPHHGSQLADLAYSNWAGWLAEIIGGRNDGTYSLQTGQMAYYRSLTDSHTDHRRNPIYTLAGTSWGGFGGALYWGGLYLRQFGQNDGAVTVSSSRLNYATEIAVGDWDHFLIANGRATFDFFKPFLSTDHQENEGATPNMELEKGSGTILRGGPGKGNVKEVIPVEDDVEAVTFSYLSDMPLDDLSLMSPSGKSYSFNDVTEMHGEFFGAWQHIASVANPEAGEWVLTNRQTGTNPYFLAVQVEGGVADKLQMELPKRIKDPLKPSIQNTAINKQTLSYDIQVSYTTGDNPSVSSRLQTVSSKNGEMNLPFNQEGSYTLTITISGKTTNQASFERTIVKNIYMDKKGDLYYN